MNKILYLPNFSANGERIVSGRQKIKGSILHYHHFLFGYLLPVVLDIDLSRNDKIYLANCKDMNVVSQGLEFLIQENIDPSEILQDTNGFDCIKKVNGFDGPNTPIPKGYIEKINSQINKILNLDTDNEEKHILLIDRGKAPSIEKRKQLSKAKYVDTKGNERRTIININEVESTLAKFGKVKRAILENLTFTEQIKLFRNSWLVFGQHGSGLSNLCFATKCKIMIEIVDDNKIRLKWFNELSKYMKIKQCQIITQRNHITVSIKMLNNLLRQVI